MAEAPIKRFTFPRGNCPGSGPHVLCNILLSNVLDRDEIREQAKAENRGLLKSSYLPGSIMSGSKAEFFQLSVQVGATTKRQFIQSDVDFLKGCSIITKYQHKISISRHPIQIPVTLGELKQRNLILVTSDVLRPGYCFVCTTDPPHDTNSKLYFLTQAALTSSEHVSSSAAYTHVPSPVNSITVDHVNCFVSQVWPESTTDIFTRRHNVWPNRQLLANIKNRSKLLVISKAHPLDDYPETEFRFSFSLLEVMLSRSLPDEVRHVYMTVKFLCKYYTPLARTQLKSYYLKTILYWIASSEDITRWHSGNFRQNVCQFLQELQKAFKTKTICNFFIPTANLIDHLDNEECANIETFVRELEQNLCSFVLLINMHQHAKVTCSANDRLCQAREAFIMSRKCADTPKRQMELKKARSLYQEMEPPATERPNLYATWLVEYGLVLWDLKDEVGAYVSWLNALVLLYTSGVKGYFMSNEFSRKIATEPVLRLSKWLGCVAGCTYNLPVVTLYYITTRFQLSHSSVLHLVQQAEQLEPINRGTFSAAFFLPILRVDRWLQGYCMLFHEQGEFFEALAKLRLVELALLGARRNVHSVCAAVSEYVQQYLPSPPPPSRRRHSFSGVSASGSRDKALGVTSLGRYTRDTSCSLNKADAGYLQRQLCRRLRTNRSKRSGSSHLVPPRHPLQTFRRRHSFCGTSVVDHQCWITDFEALGEYLRNFDAKRDTTRSIKRSAKLNTTMKSVLAITVQRMLDPSQHLATVHLIRKLQDRGVHDLVEKLHEYMVPSGTVIDCWKIVKAWSSYM